MTITERSAQLRFEAWKKVKAARLAAAGLPISHVTSHEPSTEDVLSQSWEYLSPVSRAFELDIELEFQRLTDQATKQV